MQTQKTTKRRESYSSPRQKQRKRRVLREAQQLVTTNGIDGFTMQELAERSEVSLKTLYNNFGTREQLLIEATSNVLDGIEQRTQDQKTLPAIDRLLLFTESVMEYFAESPDLARAIISLIVRSTSTENGPPISMDRIKRFAHDSLLLGVSEGDVIATHEPEKIATALAAGQWGVALLWEKRILTDEQLKYHATLSHLVILSKVCVGEKKRCIDARIEKMISHDEKAGPTGGVVSN